MDIVTVTAALTAALAPFTPYLIEGGKKFAGEAGDAAWKKAQELWGKLNEHFGNDNKLKGKILSVSADPEDKEEQTGLVRVLADRLKENPQLAEDFYKILGGSEQALQAVLADRSSWVEGIIQDMQGSGQQTINASDDSVVINVKQTKK